MAGLTAEKERTETDGSQQMHRNHQTGKHDGHTKILCFWLCGGYFLRA